MVLLFHIMLFMILESLGSLWSKPFSRYLTRARLFNSVEISEKVGERNAASVGIFGR